LPPGLHQLIGPSGDIGIDIVKTLESRGEFPSLPTSLMQTGDRVILTHYNDPNGEPKETVMDVTGFDNEGLEFGAEAIDIPKPQVGLRGEFFPEDMPEEGASLYGSHFTMNSSSTIMGSISVGNCPGFTTELGEFRLPKVSNMRLERQDEQGDFKEVPFNALTKPNPEAVAEHKTRLQPFRKLEAILAGSGFNFGDIDEKGLPAHKMVYLDDGSALYATSKGMSRNQIFLFDESGQQMIGFSLDTKSDTLQIAWQPVTKEDVLKSRYVGNKNSEITLMTPSDFHRTRQLFVTYNSSTTQRSIDDTIAFIPSVKMTRVSLAPLVKPGTTNVLDVIRPTINIDAQGKVAVAVNGYMYNYLVPNPITYDHESVRAAGKKAEEIVLAATSAVKTEQEVVLTIGGRVTKIPLDPVALVSFAVERAVKNSPNQTR